MARYKYLGEDPNWPASGPCLGIKIRKKDGTIELLEPVPPATEFPVGQDIGHDITDTTAVRQLDADTRFERLP